MFVQAVPHSLRRARAAQERGSGQIRCRNHQEVTHAEGPGGYPAPGRRRTPKGTEAGERSLRLPPLATTAQWRGLDWAPARQRDSTHLLGRPKRSKRQFHRGLMESSLQTGDRAAAVALSPQPRPTVLASARRRGRGQPSSRTPASSRRSARRRCSTRLWRGKTEDVWPAGLRLPRATDGASAPPVWGLETRSLDPGRSYEIPTPAGPRRNRSGTEGGLEICT
jgi:hypothetical protein